MSSLSLSLISRITESSTANLRTISTNLHKRSFKVTLRCLNSNNLEKRSSIRFSYNIFQRNKLSITKNLRFSRGLWSSRFNTSREWTLRSYPRSISTLTILRGTRSTSLRNISNIVIVTKLIWLNIQTKLRISSKINILERIVSAILIIMNSSNKRVSSILNILSRQQDINISHTIDTFTTQSYLVAY